MDTPSPPAAPAPAEPSPPPPPATTSGSPTDFLKGVVGKRVVVRLTSGIDYHGAYLRHAGFFVMYAEYHVRCAFMSGWVHEHRTGAD